MHRDEFLRCVAQEINDSVSKGLPTRLLVLLPRNLGHTAFSVPKIPKRSIGRWTWDVFNRSLLVKTMLNYFTSNNPHHVISKHWNTQRFFFLNAFHLLPATHVRRTPVKHIWINRNQTWQHKPAIDLTLFLTFFLTYLLTWSRLRSGTEHWTHTIAVEVRHGTLNSHDRRWGPARSTELTSSRLRSGKEHLASIIAVGDEEDEEEKRRKKKRRRSKLT